MIDYLLGEVECLHKPIPSGSVYSVTPEGDIEWQSPKAKQVEGSYSSKIMVSSSGGDGQGRATHLRFKGNPSKFLQGHNVDGSDDLNKLASLQYKKICESLPQLYNELTLNRFKQGLFDVRAIDINYLYDLNNNQSVESWLHAALYQSSTRHGKPTSTKGTLYFGQRSRRWTIKAYNKFIEITKGGKKHQLPEALKLTRLTDYTEGKLRIELRLLSLELKELNLEEARHWKKDTCKKIFNEYVKRIDMNKQATLINEEILNLPRCTQATYQLWQQGADVRQLMSKPTFYRHRNLLRDHGIDINLPPLNKNTDNVVPLVRVLEAKPCNTPAWMIQQNLIVN